MASSLGPADLIGTRSVNPGAGRGGDVADSPQGAVRRPARRAGPSPHEVAKGSRSSDEHHHTEITSYARCGGALGAQRSLR